MFGKWGDRPLVPGGQSAGGGWANVGCSNARLGPAELHVAFAFIHQLRTGKKVMCERAFLNDPSKGKDNVAGDYRR